ncbi:hypothetical protein [Gordonia rhizosphera]|uniref:Uncharacterized protein n=1 Tax=Gordonia rhizosphera NBRC 16068 TaxID=1108045 RepID=K6WB19_9ACTN|nr:hypothetical protein [Gordonia rhizosphera]GAB90956.1 hypothetical protein GORHZ_120_00120 [Gordonia rhizosphera NBRC 16068]
MKWSDRVCVMATVAFAASATLALGAGASSAAAVTDSRPGVVEATPAAPPPPPGALIAAFANNQLTYCSLICPHIIYGVVEVPGALVRSPSVYSAALARTGSVDRSRGIAAASVTGPSRRAMAGIIDNDLNLVLPRAQNALEVATVEVLNVVDTARSGAGPGAVGKAVDAGRTRVLEALNAPIVPNPPQIAVPTTPAQESALATIDVGSAVLFQAPEILLVGATESADVAAKELATSGDMNRARAAGAARLDGFVTQAQNAIARALR